MRCAGLRAVALEHYARQAKNTDAERRAADIRIRAERKAGQLLSVMNKAKGGGDTKSDQSDHPYLGDTGGEPDPPTLKELGISRVQSSRWQKLGALPQEEFEFALGESVRPPTTLGVLRSASEPPPRPIVRVEALWLWGRLLDFERDGLLDKEPQEILETMTPLMLDDVHHLAPRVANWLKRIGTLK